MSFQRILSGTAAVAAALLSAAPASAQFYFQPRDFSGPVAHGDESGLMVPLPGATADELRAEMVWSLRAALNVAALQCDFSPMLMTVPKYNHLLTNHGAELARSFATLQRYFNRTGGSAAAGQRAIDQFGTRTYAGYTSVAGQLTFCAVAADVGNAALFTPRGEFGRLAAQRLREIRNSLMPSGEMRFGSPRTNLSSMVPPLRRECWRGNNYLADRCGPLPG